LLALVIATTAARAAPLLGVTSFNVLAPIWASPVWYPVLEDITLLERVFRRGRTQAFLRSIRERTDVVCLQEVNEQELPYYLAALGDEFSGRMAYNEPSFWSNWLVPEIPWEPNGVAVAWRKDVFASATFRDLPMSGDGNHIAILDAWHVASNRPVRVFSVHLDSDRNNNRIAELRALLREYPAQPGTADLVCGDINEDTRTGSAAGLFKRAGFVDVLSTLGNRAPTHPWSTSYYNAARWAVIDHVLVRHGVARAGEVFDFGLWAIPDEAARIEANLRETGSDHFPVRAVVEL
jgi:endonuclease/exonuclease/phosphatase family metal-dependent hydrolase